MLYLTIGIIQNHSSCSSNSLYKIYFSRTGRTFGKKNSSVDYLVYRYKYAKIIVLSDIHKKLTQQRSREY